MLKYEHEETRAWVTPRLHSGVGLSTRGTVTGREIGGKTSAIPTSNTPDLLSCSALEVGQRIWGMPLRDEWAGVGGAK